MATKKISPAKHKTHPLVPDQPAAYGRLHTLLHTVRCIAQYEDVLCEITHEMKQSSELSPRLSRELDEILDKMPSHVYVSDLNAVREILLDTPISVKSGSKDSVKARKPSKNAEAEKSGRPSSK